MTREASQATRVIGSSSQAGRHPLPWESAASQEASVVYPNSTPSRKCSTNSAISQEVSNSPLLTQAILGLRQVTAQLLPRQLGRQASRQHLPWDSTTYQEASMVHSYSTPSWDGSANNAISQEGSNSPSSNSGNNRSQAGNSSASSQAVRHSTRLRASKASQADSTIPQVDSKVSQASRVSPPNSTASQATSNAGAKETGPIPPLAIIISRWVAVQAGVTGTQLGIGIPSFPRGQCCFQGK